MRRHFKSLAGVAAVLFLELAAITLIHPVKVAASGLVLSAYNLILSAGTPVAREPTLNLIPGTNTTISVVDNPGAGRTDATISAGGGSGTPGYVTTVTAQTTLSVTAATHGQGANPIAFCFDNSTPANYVACNYTVSGTGTVVFAWNPAFTGKIVIEGSSGGITNPMTGTDQYIASNGNAGGTPATFGQLLTCGSSTTQCAYSIITHLWSVLTNVTQATGDATLNLATTAYVSAALASVNPAVAVQAATTAVLSNTPTYNNGTAGVGATLTAGSNGALTIDSYVVLLNDRVLVKNQAAALQNGVYTLTTLGTGGVPYVLTRATDYNTTTNINYTGTIPVIQGTTNANTGWNLTTQIATLGTDALNYTQAAAGSSGGPPGGNVKAQGNLGNGDAIEGAGGKTIVDAGVAFSALSQGIQHGTAAMGTSAISSGACATVVTVSATGVATTDVIDAAFNGDPTAVTGYGVSATGAVLTIYPYPTANNVNFKVCNSSSGSITPGALTLNWSVRRP